MMGANRNANIPLTLNPGTRTDANQKHNPLTTKEKPPRVRIVIGKDKREMTGLTSALTAPMDNPAIKAEGKLAKLTPGKIISTTNKLRAVANNINKFPSIVFSYNFIKSILSLNNQDNDILTKNY